MRGKHELAHDLLKPINVYPGGELGCWVLWTVDRGREAQGKYKVSSLKIKAHSSEKCYNEVFQHLSQMQSKMSELLEALLSFKLASKS